ncbi:interleukin-7 isoform X1 [Saimiri boliviensis]|uniref:interleukin-7 isoform X1 n=1 Tax=Saimiri boliviensis TaxID=27679 RepID=UPI003D775832
MNYWILLMDLCFTSQVCSLAGFNYLHVFHYKDGRSSCVEVLTYAHKFLDTPPKDSMKEIGSNCLNNEFNFFKRHLCDDNKEGMFLFRAARKLRQFLKMNSTGDFDLHLLKVSQGTTVLLNCTSKVKERKPPALGEAQPTKSLEENKSLKEQKKLNESCFLKRLLQEIKTCWNKILSGTKEH